MDDLKARVIIDKPDIIAITESWANNNVLDSELYLENYSMIRKDRATGKRGGGIILYIRSEIQFVQMNSHFELESLWCTIGNKEKCKIGLYYRPPNASVESTKNMCDEISSKSYGNCIILGDFNFPDIDWNTFSASTDSAVFPDN